MDVSTLYLISTPIGNMEDITIRAIKTLWQVDVVASEDTRETQKLLHAYSEFQSNQEQPKLLSYNDHNNEKRIPEILSFLQSGKDVVLTSDRGTPLISDPGYKLVKAIHEYNSSIEEVESSKVIQIDSVPGANAILPAIQLSGFPPDKFMFIGFLPRKQTKLLKLTKTLPTNTTIVAYESPFRIEKTLKAMEQLDNKIEVAICSELTKKFQSVKRGKIDDLLEKIADKPIKGEITLVFQVNK